MRGEYTKDNERGLARWNKILEEEGLAERLYLPTARARLSGHFPTLFSVITIRG